MKFVYQYRTPDNERHDGVISAADREAAYAELKKQGIKPSRFAEAPGFFNKLFGKGKRWTAIGALTVLCVILAIAVGRGVLTAPQPSAVEASLDSSTRRQPIGDAAIIDKGIRTGWSDVFAHEGDRFLAAFAIPGTPPAIHSTTEEKLREALASSLIPHPSSLGSASLEARQIRAMVEGLKKEVRDYLAAGGSIAKYRKRLVRRQQEEIGYYQRAEREIESAKKRKASPRELEALWEKRNAELRQMGIRLVPLPE